MFRWSGFFAIMPAIPVIQGCAFEWARSFAAHFLFVSTEWNMATNLQSLLEETVPGLGYELVDVEFASRGLLRLFIDRPEGITIDDCVAVSNHLTRLFMVENIDYERLEVSSPGLDRPLKKPADFERFAGETVKVKLRVPLADRRRHFVGKLEGLIEGDVVVDVEGEVLRFPRQTVDKVRLEPQVGKPVARKKK
ncbi:MAG: ribosome maturation factor RimP [Proteobacteria bacterium]|nr:ribosome maturation factor RimP [Pseudomonadota bacterium]